jgi:hypothetical protein
MFLKADNHQAPKWLRSAATALLYISASMAVKVHYLDFSYQISPAFFEICHWDSGEPASAFGPNLSFGFSHLDFRIWISPSFSPAKSPKSSMKARDFHFFGD